MARLLLRSVLSLSLLSSFVAGGCAPAYADRVARPLVPIAVAPESVRSPYQVEIIGDGDTLDTFFHKGRYYVHGASGQHYAVRVANPTGQRVEAVVSVDGLDVIDGENGDLHKRGYVVPAYGEVVIDGWRTSLDDVASFKFSSVGGSYAGKKGKARNVGVIAVALFSEKELPPPPPPPQIIIDDDRADEGGYGADVERYLDRRAPGGPSVGERGQAPAEKSSGRVGGPRPAPPPAAPASVADS
jgi:hypothetical protein